MTTTVLLLSCNEFPDAKKVSPRQVPTQVMDAFRNQYETAKITRIEVASPGTEYQSLYKFYFVEPGSNMELSVDVFEEGRVGPLHRYRRRIGEDEN